MSKQPTDYNHHLKSYIIGFVLSLALTIEAYLLVVNHSYASSSLLIILLVMAIVQLLVQLFFFLHLDRAIRAPWSIIMLLFMGMVVAIVVFGSLWIMQNLNYHIHPPAQAEQELLRDEGYRPK